MMVRTTFFLLIPSFCTAIMFGQINRVEELRAPMLFASNKGQWNKDILYGYSGSGGSVALLEKGIMLRSTAKEESALRLTHEKPNTPVGSERTAFIRYLNPSKSMRIQASDKKRAVSHFYLSRDSTRWRTDVPNYGEVLYQNVWKNIDVLIREEEGKMTQTFVVKPGGRISNIGYHQESDNKENLSQVRMLNAIRVSKGKVIPVSVSQRIDARGDVRFSVPLRSIYDTIHLKTEFLTHFGGSWDRGFYYIQLDREENIIVAGVTTSFDYPTKNAWQSSFQGRENVNDTRDIVLTKFDPLMRNVLYSTYFGDEQGQDPWGFEIGDDGSAYVLGITSSNKIALTSNALYRNPGRLFLSRFSSTGSLLYSSFMPYNGIDLRAGPKMTRDGQNNIYVSATGDPTFITPGAVIDQPPTIFQHYLLKLTPECDKVVYGTYLQNLTSWWGIAPFLIRGDREGNLVFASSTDTSSLVLKNPIQNRNASGVSYVVYKINPAGTDFVFSTYAGYVSFSDWQWVTHFALQLDREQNIYFSGPTDNNSIPLMNPFQTNTRGDMDSFVLKLSPTGGLLFGSLLGASNGDWTMYMDLDSCGNVIVHGYTESNDLSLVSPYDTSASNTFLAVISPEYKLKKLSYIRYDSLSIWLKPSYQPTQEMQYKTVLDRYGYLYSTALFMKQTPFNVIQTKPSLGVITRRFLPFCDQDFIACNLATQDTVIVHKSRNRFVSTAFPISVQVVNTHDSYKAKTVVAELELPRGLRLWPPSQQTRVQLSTGLLLPSGMLQSTWSVIADSTITNSTCLIASVYVSYLKDDWDSAPVPLMTRCDATVCFKVSPVPDLEIACLISTTDTLTVSPDGLGYVQNPLPLQVSYKNTGSVASPISKAVLRTAKGMRVGTIPVNDTTRALPTLPAGNTTQLSWQLAPSGRTNERRVHIQSVVIDTVGFEQVWCDKEIVLPKVRGLFCTGMGTDVVRFIPGNGKTIPDSIWAGVKVDNVLDTIQSNIQVEIDLSRARYFALATGETIAKPPLYISQNFRKFATWSLALTSPPSAAATDTIVLRYKAPTDAIWYQCEWVIRLEVVLSELTCGLSAVDSFRVNGQSYTPNPFALNYSLTNIGQTLATPRKAMLSISSDAVSNLDPSEKALSDLQPNQSTQLIWNLRANTSKYNRTVTLTVVTEDSLGNELTRCEKTIFLPRIHPSLTCTLEAPDTIAYDLISDIHTPNPFTAALTLQNLLDTAEVNIETEIDLTAAPHVALVQGEPSRKMINEIAAHSQQSVIYNLEIAQRTNAPITERITIRYRAENDIAWQSCEKVIVIEGKERKLSASCSAYGPDSLFGDPAYERFIPEPAQFVYAITNKGTLPLAGCTATIIVPQDFTLVAGDATQSYGVIMPGQTVWREWSLVPAQNAPLATSTVRWQWSCDSIQTNDCTRDITLTAGAPIGFVLAPWKLRFEAEQGASLPSERTVSLWPGGGASLFWQSTNGTTWLDWSPRTDITNRRTELRVQPNTTAMPVGIYSDAITITAMGPVRPPQIEVEYEIWKVLSAKNTPSPTGVELQSWPNPTSGMTNVEFRIPHGGFVRLVLHDVYGREVGVMTEGILSGGRHTIRNDVSRLAGGVYYYTLTTATGRMTKMMVVRR